METPQGAEVETASALLHAVEAHVEAETASIDAYQDLLARSTDSLVSMVLRLVLNDEEHHHTTLRHIATMLRASPIDGPGQVEYPAEPFSEADVAVLEHAIDDEVKGAQRLREVAGAHPDAFEGLVPLLLELMAKDSEKHADLLRFALWRIREQLRSM